MSNKNEDKTVAQFSYMTADLAPMWVPELDLDKIHDLEDAKKILSFLCNLIITPIQQGSIYNEFEIVKEYFK